MKKMMKRIFVLLMIVAVCVFSLCGCQHVNNAIDEAGKAVSEGLGEVSEFAGEAISEAKDSISEGLSEASEAISDGLDAARDGISIGLENAKEGINGAIDAAESALTTTTATLPEAAGEYTFRTQALYDSHFKKHGAEFGDITQEEYLEMANKLIKLETTLTKNDGDGDLMYYDEENNEFLLLSTDGYIRTFFKPDDGIDYWNRQ